MADGRRQTLTTVVYHVGGHGGTHRSFGDWPFELRYVAFEPDPAEAETLRRDAGLVVEEVAIGDRPGSRRFHVYALGGRSGVPSGELSSLLRLAPARTHRYRDADVALAEELEIELDTLDGVAARRGEAPAFVVADVQGAEALVLAGARGILERAVLGVRLEVSFIPLYEEQPLFGEVDATMRALGFALCRIERCGSGAFGPSTDAGPFSAGLEDARPAWADAVYLREEPPDGDRWSGPALANLVAFTRANGVGSVGLDLLDRVHDAGRLEEALDELDEATREVVTRLALAQIDAAERAALSAPEPARAARDAARRDALRAALAG